MEWHQQFKYDAIKPLIESGNEAVRYFTRRDLLGENAGPIDVIWKLKSPQVLLKKQQPVGYWIYPGKNEDYYLPATFKQLQALVYQ